MSDPTEKLEAKLVAPSAAAADSSLRGDSPSADADDTLVSADLTPAPVTRDIVDTRSIPQEKAEPPPHAATVRVNQDAATIRPADEPTSADKDTPAGHASLRRFDDFELLEEIARGGMGVVFKARQVSLHRLVAVKMILSRQIASQDDLRRFEIEAEAVARLQHPNVVQIYAVGDTDGQPYLALEYVEGGSLAKKLDGAPQPARQAAELVECLARAIQVAHQHGIVHRDLKPANVLLTPEGVPKIADFGLAKRVEVDTGETRTGVILGTPSYMAPEQAGGSARNIGPAADIYALGAILYECLTGRPPFRAENPMETVVQVLADEPVPPRRLMPKLPRDLETISLKCLQKAPARRYATAAELADDLRRYLEDRPITARPIRGWQRMIKWSRRRPAAAALIAVIVVALAALIGGGAWYNARLKVAIKQSNENLATAERRLGIAQGAIYTMLERTADDLMPIPHTEGVRKKLLQDALDFYQATVRESATDETGRELLGSGYARIGDIQRLLGNSKTAEDAYLKSIEICKGLVAEFPGNSEYAATLAGAYNNLANLQKAQGRRGDAEDCYRGALTLLLPFLREGSAEIEKQTGRVYNNLAGLLAAEDRLAEAEMNHKRAIELRKKLLERHSGNSDYAVDLAISYGNLALLEMQHKRLSEAVEAFKQADAAMRQADVRALAADQRAAWARMLSNYAALMQQMNRNQEAEAAFRGAAALDFNLAAEIPTIPAYRADLADIEINLARRLILNEKRGEGVVTLRAALRLFDALTVEFPDDADNRAGAATCHRILGILGEDAPPAKPAVQEQKTIVPKPTASPNDEAPPPAKASK